MAKTRLLNADRDIIRDAMVAHKYDRLFDTMDLREHALANEVYQMFHGPHLAQIAAMPEGALPMTNNIDTRARGYYVTLRFAHNERRRVFYSVYNCHNELGMTPLAERVAELATARKELKDERIALRQRVDVALRKFWSFEDALASWPEAEKFITAQMTARGVPGPKATLPAVLLIDLTKDLGLPPEDAED